MWTILKKMMWICTPFPRTELMALLESHLWIKVSPSEWLWCPLSNWCRHPVWKSGYTCKFRKRFSNLTLYDWYSSVHFYSVSQVRSVNVCLMCPYVVRIAQIMCFDYECSLPPKGKRKLKMYHVYVRNCVFHSSYMQHQHVDLSTCGILGCEGMWWTFRELRPDNGMLALAFRKMCLTNMSCLPSNLILKLYSQ